MKQFLKTTLIGGALFLLPVALIAIILGRAMALSTKVAEPIADKLGLDRLGHFPGIAAVTVLSILMLVFVSFAGGLVARTKLGGRISGWLEGSLLANIPHYQMVKSMAEGFTEIKNADGLKPALVSIEDGWQLGYLLESLENGWVAVFLPQAPTPMSGNVMYLPTDRVRPLDISMIQAMAVVKRLGTGSGDLLRGVDLRLSAAAGEKRS
jgi:uncharacterized membrane protein